MSNPRTPTQLPPRIPTLPRLSTSPFISLSPFPSDLASRATPQTRVAAPLSGVTPSPSRTPKAGAWNASRRMLAPLLALSEPHSNTDTPASPMFIVSSSSGRLLSPLLPSSDTLPPHQLRHSTSSQAKLPSLLARSPSRPSPLSSPARSRSLHTSSPRSTPSRHLTNTSTTSPTPRASERHISPSAHLALMQKRISSPVHLSQAQRLRKLDAPFGSSPSPYSQGLLPTPPASARLAPPSSSNWKNTAPRLSPAQVRHILRELEKAEEELLSSCARLREEICEVRGEVRRVEGVVRRDRRRGGERKLGG